MILSRPDSPQRTPKVNGSLAQFVVAGSRVLRYAWIDHERKDDSDGFLQNGLKGVQSNLKTITSQQVMIFNRNGGFQKDET
jgi:hypothetical protein